MPEKVLMLFVGLTLCVLPVCAHAADFSADVVQKTKEFTAQGKIFTSGDKTRMEVPEATTIIRSDKNIMWVLMPGQNMYMEQPIGTNNIAVAREKMPGEIERVAMGQETINGQMTTKYRIVYLDDGTKTTIYQWFAKDLAIAVKTMTEDGSWATEYTNIKIGKQPDSLFEIPSGYTKFSADLIAPENALEIMGQSDQETGE
ncbi:MAG: DUF4412 domain-containing protein [Candidatus Omnitrophica bacterium]|nr:DUF4412 domain-containing protein [Candidatus Omnitrophota bacterium]